MLRNLAKAASVGRRSLSSAVPAKLPPKLLSSLENIDACQITTLENGLKVATQHTNYPTGTVGVYVDAGSRYETPGYHGASNMIEHLLFRGTQKRSGEQIRDEMARLGLQTSMNTSREICSVENRCLGKDVDAVVAHMADVVCNVKFSDADLDGEKDIVMRRVQNRSHQPHELCMDYAHNTAFMGTPLENNTIGLSDTIMTINAEDLQTYHQNYWLAPNTVVVAVGPFGHDHIVSYPYLTVIDNFCRRIGTLETRPSDEAEALKRYHLNRVELVQKNFANQPTAPASGDFPYRGVSRFTSGEMEYRDDSYPLVYCTLAFEGMGFSDPDNAAMDVVGSLIGNYDRTKDITGTHVLKWRNELVNPQRYTGEHRVLVNKFFNINYRDNGLWGVYLEMEDEHQVPDNTIHKLFRNEFCRYALGPADEEVELGKEINKVRMIREETANGSLSLARRIGKEVVYTGTKKPLLERVDEMESIQTADIRDLFMRKFYDMDFVSAKMGRSSSMPEAVAMRCWTSRWMW